VPILILLDFVSKTNGAY